MVAGHLLLPVLGALASLVLGRAGLPEARKQKQRGAIQRADSQGPAVVAPEGTRLPRYACHAVELNLGNGGFPLVAGNRSRFSTRIL